MATGRILGGLAILENAYHETARVVGVPVEGLFETEERLLVEARGLMGRLPLDEIDVLVCDRLGKNVSGTGLDTNVTGRSVYGYTPGAAWCEGMPRIMRIVVLDVSDESDGNAVGMGQVDLVPERFASAGRPPRHHPQRPHLLRSHRRPDARRPPRRPGGHPRRRSGRHRSRPDGPRIVYVRDTLELEHVLISAASRPLVEDRDDIEILSGPEPLRFDDHDRLRSPFRLTQRRGQVPNVARRLLERTLQPSASAQRSTEGRMCRIALPCASRTAALASLAALLLALPPVAAGADSDPLYASFREPPSQYRPFVRWWWNGGCVTEAEVLRELDLMKEAGIGGVEINTIEMPEQSIPGMLDDVRCLEWLSPEWNDVVRATTVAVRERGMTADLIVGSGWPFGGRFLEGADRTQRVRVVKVPLPEAGTFDGPPLRARRREGEAPRRDPRRAPPRVPAPRARGAHALRGRNRAQRRARGRRGRRAGSGWRAPEASSSTSGSWRRATPS